MQRLWLVTRIVLIALVGVYLAAGALLYALQDKLLFPAPGGVARDALDQAATEVGATPIDLVASDGTHLYAWHRTAPRTPDTRPRLVMYFPGNAELVSDNLPLHRLWLAEGFDVLALAYRGYPGSEGAPSEAGLGLDAEAAWAWATGPGGYPPDRVVLHGRSLGGGVVGMLAAGPANPAAVVLESTFSSVTTVAQHGLARFYPVSWLLRNPFDTRERAPQFGVPVFLMASTDDEVVPIALGARALVDHLADVEVHEVSGLGHNDCIPVHREAVRAAYLAFLERVVPR